MEISNLVEGEEKELEDHQEDQEEPKKSRQPFPRHITKQYREIVVW